MDTGEPEEALENPKGRPGRQTDTGKETLCSQDHSQVTHRVHRMRNSATSAILPGGPNGHCGPLSILDRCHVPSLKLLEDTGISSLLCLCHILSRFKAEGYRPHSHLTPKKAHSLRNPPKMGGWLQKLSRQKMANVFYK